MVPGEVEDHGNGTYTITFTPQTAGPHQLHITMDGEHVQSSPFTVKVLSDCSTLCHPQKLISVNGKPLSVAVHEDGDLYVGCITYMLVFDQDGHLKNTIGRGGSGDGQFCGRRCDVRC